MFEKLQLQLEAEGSHACHVGFKAGCLDPSHVLQTRSLVHVKSQYLWITVNAFILSCILHNLAGFFFLRNTRFPQNKLHCIYTAVWNRICTFRNTLIQNTLICWNINLWQISYAINTVCLQLFTAQDTFTKKEGYDVLFGKSRHAYSIQFLLLYSLQDCKEKENDKVCLVRMNYNQISNDIHVCCRCPPPLLH